MRSIFRGTPLVLQLILFYNALPHLGIVLPGLLAVGPAKGARIEIDLVAQRGQRPASTASASSASVRKW
ncbi:hypothetical protein [Variovorax paradoxus]|uniref:Uncharacterized protein n=1 Tax=Variovorax paradoxus TaxID=34073 RepID=A0A6I6H542_VARPD|nr:hypothetical protein [Variovorax paradoxus]QGW81993.1 hypothetical protein GOQ09_10505 [Variovorax paradoxus]